MMIELTEQIKSLDIIEIIRADGVELTRKGNKYVGLCPLHNEKNPSLVVIRDTRRFKCFGCGEYGDAVDYIQKLYGYDFKQACHYLGIQVGPLSEEDHQKIAEKKQKREESKKYRRRESDLAYTFGTLIRWAHMAMNAIKTVADMEEFSDVYHVLPFWEHYHDILCQKDHQERRQVIEALKDIKTIERNPLFKEDFDFPGWLRNFINGEPINAKHERIKISFN